MTCIVRQASLEDMDFLATAFDAYRQFYGQMPDLAGARSFLNERIAREQSIVFLAYQFGQPTQYLGFTQVYPSFTSVGMKKILILNDLFVLAPYRRQGVAEALIRAVLDLARSLDAIRVVLQTAYTNADAQHLYNKMGFVLEAGYYTYEYSLG